MFFPILFVNSAEITQKRILWICIKHKSDDKLDRLDEGDDTSIYASVNTGNKMSLEIGLWHGADLCGLCSQCYITGWDTSDKPGIENTSFEVSE